jgi:hypothetical protein
MVCLGSTGSATQQAGQVVTPPPRPVATPTPVTTPTPTPTPQSATGLIAGRVVDSAGNPVPNAIVFIRKGPLPATSRFPGTGTADRVLSDDAGRFVFNGLTPGPYSLEATKPGWLMGAYGRRVPGNGASVLELTEGERRNDLSITLWRTAVIAGRVIADNGDPMVGVEVRAMKQVFMAGRRQSEIPIRAKTDDLGAYRFSDLVPGEYLVAVLSSVLSEPPGFAGAIRAGSETPRAYYQTMTDLGVAPIVFDRATGVAGANRPLVGSLSQLSSVPVDDGAWPAYPTTFHPSSTSMRSATIVRAVSGEARTAVDVTVRLTPTWQVSGVLRDPDGPAAWNAVHLIPAEAADTPLVDTSTAVTDATGAFTFYGVPAGQYIARVVRVPYPTGQGARMTLAGGTGAIPHVLTVFSGPAGASPVPTEPLLHVSEPVTVANRNIEGLMLTMREGPRVRGRVRYDGAKPPPGPMSLGAPVFAVPANGRLDTASVPGRLSNDGQQFVLPSQWPGRYLIRSVAPTRDWVFKDATYQGRNISDTPIDLTADLDNVIITFIESARTIKGTVRGDTGKAVEGSSVLLFPTDPAGWVDYGRSSRRVTSTTVSASGGFTFELPPPGDYYLIAVPAEMADGWQNPAVLAKIAASAERIRVEQLSLTQALQLKEIR